MPNELTNQLLALINVFVTVFMVLLILSGRREARATLGWLLLVIFLPYAGAFLYLLIGRTRPDYISHKIHPALNGKRSDACKTDAGGDPYLALTECMTGLSTVKCGELTLLEGAEKKYELLFKDIAEAKSRIVLCYYVFRNDGTGARLLELLARKAEEGVKVYLLYDGWGAFALSLPFVLKKYVKRGVKAAPFAPVANPLRMSRINFRNHRKIVVIDGFIGYTGSTNIGDEYLSTHSVEAPWRDLHARLTGSAARVLEEVFAEDWRNTTGETLELTPSAKAEGEIQLHVIPTGPDLLEDRLFPLLMAHLSRAETSIEIATPYLIPNQAVVAALTVAAMRGVKVRVLVPSRSNHPMVAAAGRSYYEELLDGGVEICQMPNTMLHAKAFLIDQKWAMLGSANFDNRSFFLNFEINIGLSDPAFVKEIKACFDRWRAMSTATTREDLAKMSATQKLLDSICRTLSPVL